MTFRVLPDAESVARAAAREVVTAAREAVEERGRFLLGLAGGSTPRGIHAVLAGELAKWITWETVHLFWGDERCVGPDHPESNYGMARETLISRVPIPAENVERMRGEAREAEAEARRYEDALRGAGGGLDLILLGMGTDGHTASLFPDSPALEEKDRWVVPSLAPEGASVRERLTLTLPAIAAARRVLFAVTGSAKRDALAAIRRDPAASDLPAARVTARRTVLWLADEAASEDA